MIRFAEGPWYGSWIMWTLLGVLLIKAPGLTGELIGHLLQGIGHTLTALLDTLAPPPQAPTA